MRLTNVEHGHTPQQKAFLEQAQAMRGKVLPLPDIIRLLLYRPELFGTAFSIASENAMHKPSDWSFGERELFAAFVSHQNQCAF